MRQLQTAMDTNQGRLHGARQPEQTLRRGLQLSVVPSRAENFYSRHGTKRSQDLPV